MTYTVADIMQRYHVTQHTVLNWIHRGELKAINVGVAPGKKKARWRITEGALLAFEELRAATPSIPTTGRRRKSKAKANVVEFY